MVDGSYSIMLKTPMGVKNGELALKTDNGVLSGKMSIMGNDNPIGQGTTNVNELILRFTQSKKTTNHCAVLCRIIIILDLVLIRQNLLRCSMKLTKLN